MRALRAAVALGFAIACAGACTKVDAPPAAPAAKAVDPACLRAEVAAAGNSLAVYLERSRALVLQVQAYPNDPRYYEQNLETDLKELTLLVGQVERERVPACAAAAKELAIAAMRGIHEALDMRRPGVDQESYKRAFDAAQDKLTRYNAEIRRAALAATP